MIIQKQMVFLNTENIAVIDQVASVRLKKSPVSEYFFEIRQLIPKYMFFGSSDHMAVFPDHFDINNIIDIQRMNSGTVLLGYCDTIPGFFLNSF